MPEYKRSYRKGYVTESRINDENIELLIGIPYPNDKWYCYIEKRTAAIHALYRELGVHLTYNHLIDQSNLQQYLKSYRVTVVRLSKSKNSNENTYYLKFIGHDAIEKYPIDTDKITWERKYKKEITHDDAMVFLNSSILSPIMKYIKKFENWRDIPDGCTLIKMVIPDDVYESYRPILAAAYGTQRLMVQEMYLRNFYTVDEELLSDYRATIEYQKNKEAPVDETKQLLDKFVSDI